MSGPYFTRRIEVGECTATLELTGWHDGRYQWSLAWTPAAPKRWPGQSIAEFRASRAEAELELIKERAAWFKGRHRHFEAST
jgi:hypothetical protein